MNKTNCYQIHNFFSNGVVSSRVIVGRILLSGHELLRMEELAVSSGPDFVYHGRLQVDEHGTWDMLSGAGFWKKKSEL